MSPSPDVRDEFPVLSRCVYLNSNSTGAFPRGARAVLDGYWATLEDWRDEAWESWWGELHAYCDAVAAFVGGTPGSVVTDANATSLLARLATALDFQSRPRVVISDLEFPTMEVLWRSAARLGAELVVVPSRGLGSGVEIDAGALIEAIDARTRLVCVSHATFATGALLDVRHVARAAHDAGAWLALDAYQTLGVVPVDVNALDVDFLLGGAHKWLCGAPDLGFLWIRPELVSRLEPVTGWMALADPLSFRASTELAPGARRLASGTPAVLPAMFSRVGLELIREAGIETIRRDSIRRSARIIERADASDVPVATPRDAERRGGIVCLRPAHAEALTARLKARGFVASHRDGIRIAPHFYNTDDEVERFMDALDDELRAARA